MPQMAPLKWIILFMLFLLTYLFVNFINYFLFKPKISDLKEFKKNSKKMFFKW